ncbi:MAG: hypothetical protein PWQ55_120 [Chloroflexota bacterium]|nr:hypothetical protein [Chloroflexota bacterium]
MRSIKERLTSDDVWMRVGTAALLFLILFFGLTVISYFLLPQGILKNKHPLQQWETSTHTPILVLQIFFYNLLSVLVILAGNLFASKMESESRYFPTGYTAFFLLVCINGIVLGTWSFSVEHAAVPLLDRLLRTFDLVHRAGLWEMAGQLLAATGTAQIAIVRTSGRETLTGKFSDIRLRQPEKITLALGIVFILVGALVESIAINTL